MKPFKAIFLLVSLIVFASCQQSTCVEQEAALVEMEKVIEEMGRELKAISEKANKKHIGDLVHLVYFSLKPELSEQEFSNLRQEILKLNGINFLNDLEIGTFENLGDVRAMDQFTMLMQMRFKDKKSYQEYQDHPIHLQLKKDVVNYLSGPPVTYDYIIQ